jgi:hypothetical protein
VSQPYVVLISQRRAPKSVPKVQLISQRRAPTSVPKVHLISQTCSYVCSESAFNFGFIIEFKFMLLVSVRKEICL